MSPKDSCCCQQSGSHGRPEDCSPEQIEQCHGDSGEHPCTDPNHPCQQGECPEGKQGSGSCCH
jgi:hypothetical protein